LVTGKGNRPGGCLGDSGTAVVSVLPKTARHERESQDHKCNQSQYDDGREPDKVFCVLESLHEWISLLFRSVVAVSSRLPPTGAKQESWARGERPEKRAFATITIASAPSCRGIFMPTRIL
jgi:hypothetical protein